MVRCQLGGNKFNNLRVYNKLCKFRLTDLCSLFCYYLCIKDRIDYGKTNAIEAINSSFRKVTKKGTLESEESLLKALYLRLTELEKKWSKGKIRNWSMVLNQLMVDERFRLLIERYSDK